MHVTRHVTHENSNSRSHTQRKQRSRLQASDATRRLSLNSNSPRVDLVHRPIRIRRLPIPICPSKVTILTVSVCSPGGSSCSESVIQIGAPASRHCLENEIVGVARIREEHRSGRPLRV